MSKTAPFGVRGIVRAVAAVAAAALGLSLLAAAPAGAVDAAPAALQKTALAGVDSAAAIVGSDFNNGNIISDDLFYDSAAMSEAQIQAFLNARLPGPCTNGKCLTVGRFSVASRPISISDTTGNVRCQAFAGGDNLSAATIIFRAQTACGISARVILVTLQKEQGLITKTAPVTAH